MTDFQRKVVGGILLALLVSVLYVPWVYEGSQLGAPPRTSGYAPVWTVLNEVYVRVLWERVLVQAVAIVLAGGALLNLVKR